MKLFPTLSHFQTKPLLAARAKGLSSAPASIDLGLTACEAQLFPDRVQFDDRTALDWQSVEAISKNENACFSIQDNLPVPVRGFSEMLSRACSLMPTSEAPVMIIAGFPMHRFNRITPLKAAEAMVGALKPITGSVLDTATGLGYTAIIAAKTAAHVTTIELCPVAQEMARMNPWSQDLFDNPKITQIMGDGFEEIQKFADASFSAILHDPPTMSLAGDLYSGAFYRQAYRVLRPQGKMFHYIGDPASAAGARVTKGVVKRLYDAGFAKVTPVPGAFGVVACKQ